MLSGASLAGPAGSVEQQGVLSCSGSGSDATSSSSSSNLDGDNDRDSGEDSGSSSSSGGHNSEGPATNSARCGDSSGSRGTERKQAAYCAAAEHAGAAEAVAAAAVAAAGKGCPGFAMVIDVCLPEVRCDLDAMPSLQRQATAQL
jgi:hypothetical protein